MNTEDMPTTREHVRNLAAGLAAHSSSTRLQAALAAGSTPDPGLLPVLVERCAVEPDFFVRDMLTWAITRLPAELTVPELLRILAGYRGNRQGTRASGSVQAVAQALHTLSKIGDIRGWPAITDAMFADPDDTLARTAWRAAAKLVPAGAEASLAQRLTSQLGRGGRETWLSLARVHLDLGESVRSVLEGIVSAGGAADGAGGPVGGPAARAAEHSPCRFAEQRVAHAMAILRLFDDPDAAFAPDLAEARRVRALSGFEPGVGSGDGHEVTADPDVTEPGGQPC
ncbi:HEAT repeat domain-containing protein [Brevibacterium sp. 50QC2O2]|uniref:HEAT repeat domain-containing protein n=1 Tax=Brevibacterium TaxID=1696 RepID=UPI00211BAEC9|nr:MULTISPECIES: HEAT repeat domain-containing protein [unclassified Brevibacterium]MCQ9385780.1 HEAT repeat domain-containing protein [Brevibacterium sp. 68QC2CO]MCQ9389791.1 HEAT repeat domain-containing protein [Brevibacterium sp. 50QC2O2]